MLWNKFEQVPNFRCTSLPSIGQLCTLWGLSIYSSWGYHSYGLLCTLQCTACTNGCGDLYESFCKKYTNRLSLKWLLIPLNVTIHIGICLWLKQIVGKLSKYSVTKISLWSIFMKCAYSYFQLSSQPLHFSSKPNWENYFKAFLPGSMLIMMFYFLATNFSVLYDIPLSYFSLFENCKTSSYYSSENISVLHKYTR